VKLFRQGKVVGEKLSNTFVEGATFENVWMGNKKNALTLVLGLVKCRGNESTNRKENENRICGGVIQDRLNGDTLGLLGTERGGWRLLKLVHSQRNTRDQLVGWGGLLGGLVRWVVVRWGGGWGGGGGGGFFCVCLGWVGVFCVWGSRCWLRSSRRQVIRWHGKS